jgi:hypothetical protein
MQCLAPIEPREAGPRAATASRLPFALAVTIGVALVALVLLNWREVVATFHRHTVLQAELAICAGTIAGLLLSRVDATPLIRRRLAMLDALYERAASAPVCVEPGYTHYLPCVLLMQEEPSVNLLARVGSWSDGPVVKGAAGCILYVGPRGVLMRTQDAGRATGGTTTSGVALFGSGFAGAAPTDLGPVRQVTAVSIALPQSQLARVARMRPRHAMLLRWPTGQALLAIPSIGDTLPRLHRCLDDLRWES